MHCATLFKTLWPAASVKRVTIDRLFLKLDWVDGDAPKKKLDVDAQKLYNYNRSETNWSVVTRIVLVITCEQGQHCLKPGQKEVYLLRVTC